MKIIHKLSTLCLAGLLVVAPAAQAVYSGTGIASATQGISTSAPLVGAALLSAARDKGTVAIIVEFDGTAVNSGIGGFEGSGRTATRGAADAASTAAILAADLNTLDAAQERQRVQLVGQARDAFVRSVANQGTITNVRGMTYSTAVSMTVDATALQALQQNPAVTRVYEDALHSPALVQSLNLINVANAWSSNHTGAGQTIAILDTGVDKNHPMLAGKVVSEACYSQNLCPGGATSSTAPGSGVNCSTSISSSCGHGTHVAGIAAGKDPGGTGLNGVAKDANIIAIQVFTQFGSDLGAYTSDIVRGLERVFTLRNTYNIASANMSLGGSTLYSSYCDSTGYKPAIDQLRSVGIATVIAAGNNGSRNSLSSPACTSSAVSVGATLDTANTVSSYSNIASFVSLVAPGSSITSAYPGGGTQTWNGTSMAAPHVAGAWAVRKQQVPNESVADALGYFRANAVTMSDTRGGATITGLKRLNFPTDGGGNPSEYQLSVSKVGNGTVTSSPAGINCGSTCSANFAVGASVALSASASSGYRFSSWSGACTGTGSCSVTMSGHRSVIANFTAENIDDHGDSIGSATGVDLGSDTSGVINRAGDNDYFRVTITETGTLTLYTNGTTDTYGYLLNGSGSVLSSNDDSGNGLNFRIERVVSPGTYYVRVRHYSSGGTGPYTLSVRFSAGTPVARLRAYKAGSGTVTSSPAGIDCGSNCTANFPVNSSVTLRATPASGYEFYSWYGHCSGTSATCTLTVNSNGLSYAYAYFRPIPQVNLFVYKRGSGTVTSSPSGIDCGSSCQARFNRNSSVTLTASPSSGNRFARWSGYCSGSSTNCTLSMTQSKYAIAYFEPVTPPDDHGDSTSTATSVALPSNTNGVIGHARDNDYFRVVVPSSGYLTATTAGSTDTYGYVLNSSGSVIAANDDSGAGLNFRIDRYVTAGTYYVRVRHYSSYGTGAYQLQLSLRPVQDRLYTYQGGGYGTITSSPSGINCSSSYCYASFDRGSTVTLTATPPSGYAFQRWAGSCGGTSSTCTVSMSGGTRSAVAYYIRATGTTDDHANNPVAATPIALGRYVAGRIERAGDNDFFRITLTSAGHLTAFTYGSTDTFGYLYDARGRLIAYNDDSGSGLNFLFTSGTLNRGNYYLRVRHWSSRGTGAYYVYAIAR